MSNRTEESVSNEKVCFICLDNSNNLIEYNHCGLYYVHFSCLNDWNPNECIICRKKIITDLETGNSNNINIETGNSELVNYETRNSENDNNLITILNHRRNNKFKIIHFCITFNFLSCALYLFIQLIIYSNN
tara:strand:+ start:186 stop:581 length:396 start_codon:yes stop_codon:yes gene_type:complete